MKLSKAPHVLLNEFYCVVLVGHGILADQVLLS